MAKTQNDKSYERGVKDGLKGNLLDDICHANNIIPSTTNAEKTYDKGKKVMSISYDTNGELLLE